MQTSKHYIGEVYSCPPNTVQFDPAWIDYNREYTDIEYQSIKDSLVSIGQTLPIAINSETGRCEDGRTRTKICTELGIDVLCQRIDGSLDAATRRDVYMQNTTGRENSVAQKAVMAYQYMIAYNCKRDVAALKHKVTTRSIDAIVTIAGLKRQDILDSLLRTGKWNGSINVRTIAAELRASTQDTTITPSRTNVKKVDHVDMINTELGKVEYWRLNALTELDANARRDALVELINYKYVLTVDGETGEVTEEELVNDK